MEYELEFEDLPVAQQLSWIRKAEGLLASGYIKDQQSEVLAKKLYYEAVSTFSPLDYREKQQFLTELNADGNSTRGRYGEDLS